MPTLCGGGRWAQRAPKQRWQIPLWGQVCKAAGNRGLNDPSHGALGFAIPAMFGRQCNFRETHAPHQHCSTHVNVIAHTKPHPNTIWDSIRSKAAPCLLCKQRCLRPPDFRTKWAVGSCTPSFVGVGRRLHPWAMGQCRASIQRWRPRDLNPKRSFPQYCPNTYDAQRPDTRLTCVSCAPYRRCGFSLRASAILRPICRNGNAMHSFVVCRLVKGGPAPSCGSTPKT